MASVSVWGGSGGSAHSSRPGSLAFPASAVVTLRPSGEFHSPRDSPEAGPAMDNVPSFVFFILVEVVRVR